MKVCVDCGSDRVSAAWVCADCGSIPATVGGFAAFAPGLASENPGFHADYFAELAALEARNFWFRSRNELILWALRKYVPECRSFLEIGCGTGFVLSGIAAAFPTMALTGSEIFSAGLAFAAARVPSATFYQMDARRISFRDEFDAVGAFDVLEHIDEDGRVVAAVADALRPGGTFIASVPQHPALWSEQDEIAFHARRYTARGLRRIVESAGFEVVRMTSFVSLLLPLMLASRRRQRRAADPSEVDAMGDLRQPRVVNMALERVMTVERTMIRNGASFPAGGSLLMIARKRSRPGETL